MRCPVIRVSLVLLPLLILACSEFYQLGGVEAGNAEYGTEAGNAQTIVGHVYHDNQPQAMAMLYYASTADCQPETGCKDSTQTNEEGYFKIDSVPAGEILLQAFTDSVALLWADTVVEKDSIVYDSLHLKEYSTLIGRVEEIDQGIVIQKSFIQPMTDSLGHFKVQVPVGSYTLTSSEGAVITTVEAAEDSIIPVGVISVEKQEVTPLDTIVICGDYSDSYYKPEKTINSEITVAQITPEEHDCLKANMGKESKYGFDLANPLELDQNYSWSLVVDYKSSVDTLFLKLTEAKQQEYSIAMDTGNSEEGGAFVQPLNSFDGFDLSVVSRIYAGSSQYENVDFEITRILFIRN